MNQTRAVTPQEPIQEDMWADEPELSSVNPSAGMEGNIVDDDMDMMDTSEPVSQSESQNQQLPPQQDNTTPSVTGRIPTPIHCSFAAQVRGNSWSGRTAPHGDVLATTPEEPNAAAFSSNGLLSMPPQQIGVPTGTPAIADWSMVENRRLPSPISECGAEDSQASSRMAVDASSPRGSSRLSLVTHEHPLVAELPPRSTSAFEGRSDRQVTPASSENNNNYNGTMDVESPATGSPPKKGHTRSKHTLNSWTALQPGMTRSFSIGYRADCEKCRNKQPGHFNHIIIS